MPLVMYADIGAILQHEPVVEANTLKTRKHVPAAIGNIVMSRIPNHPLHGKYVQHYGENCINQFINYLEKICKEIFEIESANYTRIKAQRNFAEIELFKMQRIVIFAGKFLMEIHIKGMIRILIMI